MSMRSSAGLRSIGFDLVEFRQDRHRAGRRVNASLRFGRRHALHAMRAGFELEMRERAAADDAADDFLVAAVLARDFPTALRRASRVVGIARVHAKQIAREDRGLIAAGAGAHFEIDVAVVARDPSAAAASRALPLRARCARSGSEFFAAELAQLGVVAFGHFLRVCALGRAGAGIRDSAPTTGSSARILHRQLAEFVVSPMTCGIGEQRAHFFVPLDELLQFVANRIFHS